MNGFISRLDEVEEMISKLEFRASGINLIRRTKRKRNEERVRIA